MHNPRPLANPDVAEAVVDREAALLAPYAMHSASTAGRRYPEPPHLFRGPYEVDRDRVLRSAAYRRLSHKTQVFTGEFGDYHRTRLTHTLEVVSFARALGRALRLNEDLIEALALVHDLGHPPFGHAGETVLKECLVAEGGFCHNRHALRIVEELERCDRRFSGLNLSQEVIDGQRTRFERSDDEGQPPLEVQVVEAADSVAYDTHDADDALELGLVTIEEVLEQPLWQEAARRVGSPAEHLAAKDLRRALLGELIEWQLADLVEHARRQIRSQGVAAAADVQHAEPLVVASDTVSAKKLALERFLQERVYHHPDVLRSRERAQNVLRQLFAIFCRHPEEMPTGFQVRANQVGLARSVGDYLAGMTDRYVYKRFRRLVSRRPAGWSRGGRG